MTAQTAATGQYADVNGLRLYYEVHGSGTPLVLLHGGGSTIVSNYGRVLPAFAKNHRVIAIELQAHGHTLDIDRPLSFAQDADDVDALLEQLHIAQADVMGFSNGGTTALQLAIRHPKRVRKLVAASTAYRRDGMMEGFFDMMAHTSFDQMPQPLKDAYLVANPDTAGLHVMFARDVARMVGFADIPDADIRAIQAPTLVINGDKDVVTNEHALLLSRTLPHARLAVLPSAHGDYIGECCAADKNNALPELTVAMIEEFLRK